MAIRAPEFDSYEELIEALKSGVAIGDTDVYVRGIPHIRDDGICEECGDHEDDHNETRWKACYENACK